MQYNTGIFAIKRNRLCLLTIYLSGWLLITASYAQAQTLDGSAPKPMRIENFIKAKPFDAGIKSLDFAEIESLTQAAGQQNDKQNDKQSDADKQAIKINPLTDMGDASARNYKPLTSRQRWHLYLNQTFATPGAYLGVIIDSVLDQASRQPPEWGSGASGYGKRFAFRLGTNVLQSSIQSGAAALLKEDPRYIRSKDRGFFRRSGHALLYTVVTYNNDGRPTPAIANISAIYATSIISAHWLPPSSNNFGFAMRNANRAIALGALYNMIDEFWPDMMRALKRHHH